ncbi:MAG: ribbon-helix-helix protein, CopG family [Dehalococcoidia bacterium]|nr:ribbon-helix-helix protein, CopG family [Dehalococcoidia bacterium]
MARTTISLPDDLLKRIKVLAAERGTSMAGFIREAVEEKAAARRPMPRSIGIAESSGPGYTARDAGDIHFEPRTWRSS